MNTVEFANKIFSATNIKGIEPLNYTFHSKYKIAVYSPVNTADELSFQMAAAGAGIIGNYTVCSFRTKGVGTFIGSKKSSPSIGKKGKFEMVEEVRLEMICEEAFLNDVIDSIYSVHPYEEPAYEIYPVMIRDKKPNEKVIAVSFKKKISLGSIMTKINNSLKAEVIKGLPLNAEIWSAVIDFSGEDYDDENIKGKKRVLYIIKKSNNLYNIRLV
jgi:hypothetical protein